MSISLLPQRLGSAAWRICWGSIMPFSVLMYAGADSGSDFGALATFACFPAPMEASSPFP